MISVWRITAEEVLGTRNWGIETDMNTVMTLHRTHNWSRAAFVATVVTGLAALTAWVLSSVVHLSEPAVVITVMVAAFCASWIVTNHRSTVHRVTLIPVHARTR